MLPSSKLLLFLVLFQFQRITTSYERPLVLRFRPKEETVHPRVKVLTTFTSMRAFSICFWYRPTGIASEHNGLLDYEISNSVKNEILISFPGLSKVCIGTENSPKASTCIDYKLPLLKWQHICFLWASYNGKVDIYINGKLSGNGTDYRQYRQYHNYANGELYIGADQTTFGSNKFQNAHNSIGDISEMHIWDRKVCPSQIQQMASCQSTRKGNVMSWGKTQMILMDKVQIGTDPAICCEQDNDS